MRRLSGGYRMLVLVVVLAASGCAPRSQSPAHPDSAFQARARAVADTWHGAVPGPAGDAWRTGFVALQDLTVPPAEGFTDDLRFAFASGWYTIAVDLPTAVPAGADVSFPDGTRLRVPLVSAGAAYRDLHQADPPCRRDAGPPSPAAPLPSPTAPPPVASAPDGAVGTLAPHTCAVLTVTGATLGTTTLRTSRGLATVPAWLFTVRELPAPIARAAFAAGSTTPVAYPSLPPAQPDQIRGVAGADKLRSAQDTRLEFTIGVGACDRNPTGLVYETDDAVVIGGRIDAPTTSTCIDLLSLAPVTVTLARPLGSRAVFDAVSGRPMIQTNARF